MKRNHFIALLLLSILFLGCTSKTPSNITVATLNIRLDTPVDGPNRWEYRRQHVYEFVKEQQLSIIGFQEVLENQLRDMETNMPEYRFVGVGRDDGKTQGEYSPIAYLNDSYELLDSNTFWLAENPDSVGMVSWDAALTRIATWAKLKDKSNGKTFMVVNTHFDHVGVEARKNSALLIIKKIKEIVGNKPAIITGDFNVTDQSDAYRTMTENKFVLKDAHKIADEIMGLDYTFHNFGKISEDPDGGEKIDFIFVTPQVNVLKSNIPSAQIDSVLYLTDHNPQIAYIRL